MTTAFKADFRNLENEYTHKQKQKELMNKEQLLAVQKETVQEAELLEAFQKRKKLLYQERYNALSDTKREEYKAAFLDQLGTIHIAARYIEKE